MNENVDIFDMSQDVGGIAPLQFNRPGPVIDYLTRPMVPSPKSRRRDTLRGIASFVPFLSGELAKAEGDTLGVALSPLDALGPAGVPAKAVARETIKKGIASLDDDMLDLKKILEDPNLSNTNKLEQASNHPSIIKAEKMMNEIPVTKDMPGYGTDDFVKNRQFNFDNKTVTGYEDAVDELYKGGKTLAYREQGIEIPTNIMAKNTGDRLATIVIGPPAAGKSAISNPIAIKTNSVIIDADEAKKVLPEYQGGVGSNATHHESKVLSNEVMDVAMARGDNLVLPKVGGNPDAIRVLSEILKSNGYKVNLVLTEIDPDLALVRMNNRFIKKGRLINSDYAQANKGKPNLTYEKLKQEGIADGYGKIDTTTRVGEPKKIFEDTANIFTETGL
jgi:predicted ABC-type ATPase